MSIPKCVRSLCCKGVLTAIFAFCPNKKVFKIRNTLSDNPSLSAGAGLFCVPRRAVCAVVAAFFVKQNFCRFVVDKRLLLTVCSFCFWGSGRTPCCSRDALSAALFPYRGIRRRQACRQRSKTPYCFLRKVCPPDR